MNLTLVYPMFAMVMLTFITAWILFASRVIAFRKKQVSFHYFKSFEGEQATQWMTKASRHYANLFEVPVLYYAGCITAMVIPITGIWVQIWAWLFVLARVMHAGIHLGPNKVRPRMLSFTLGFFCVIALWIEIVISLR